MTELELKKYSRNALLGSFVSMLTAGLATMMYSVCISTIRTDLALTAVQGARSVPIPLWVRCSAAWWPATLPTASDAKTS